MTKKLEFLGLPEYSKLISSAQAIAKDVTKGEQLLVTLKAKMEKKAGELRSKIQGALMLAVEDEEARNFLSLPIKIIHNGQLYWSGNMLHSLTEVTVEENLIRVGPSLREIRKDVFMFVHLGDLEKLGLEPTPEGLSGVLGKINSILPGSIKVEVSDYNHYKELFVALTGQGHFETKIADV